MGDKQHSALFYVRVTYQCMFWCQAPVRCSIRHQKSYFSYIVGCKHESPVRSIHLISRLLGFKLGAKRRQLCSFVKRSYAWAGKHQHKKSTKQRARYVAYSSSDLTHLIDESLDLVVHSAEEAMYTSRIHVEAHVARLHSIQCSRSYLRLVRVHMPGRKKGKSASTLAYLAWPKNNVVRQNT